MSKRRPRALYGVGVDPDPRFTLANERTLLAWIRTALAFSAGGLALLLTGDQLGVWSAVLSTSAFALALTMAMGALIRWFQTERALRMGGGLPTPWLAITVVAVLIVGIIGGLTATLLVS